MNIFLDDHDYINFIKRLFIILGFETNKGHLRITPVNKNSFELIAYCLMSNHFHLLIKQNTDVKIGTIINRICTSYVKYFNKKYSKVGGLFQDTYKAKLIENDVYLSHLTAYIHNNPPDSNYNYSSFSEYLGHVPGYCSTGFVLKMFNNDPLNYKKFVEISKKNEAIFKGDL